MVPRAELPPAGWYPDPANRSTLRWWNGTTWTTDAFRYPRSTREDRVPRSLPWRSWIATLAVIAITGLVCFGKAEATTVTPGRWFGAGFCVVAIIAVIGSTLTLNDRPWTSVLLFGLLVAGVVALTIFMTAAPSTSAACSSASDCDTSYGLGLPFLIAFLAVPAFAIAGIGKAMGTAVRTSRLRHHN